MIILMHFVGMRTKGNGRRLDYESTNGNAATRWVPNGTRVCRQHSSVFQKERWRSVLPDQRGCWGGRVFDLRFELLLKL